MLDVYFAQNRFYDPSIKRFTQVDPIKDGTNFYVYCGNNPIINVDVLGLLKTYGGKSQYSSYVLFRDLISDLNGNGVQASYTYNNATNVVEVNVNGKNININIDSLKNDTSVKKSKRKTGRQYYDLYNYFSVLLCIKNKKDQKLYVDREDFLKAFNVPSDYDVFKFIGFGLQAEFSLVATFGLELVYYTSANIRNNSSNAFNVYTYGGAGIDSSMIGEVSSLLDDFKVTTLNPLKFISNIDLSASLFAIFGNPQFKSAKDYEGAFTSYKATINTYAGYVAKSPTCTAVGVGRTTAKSGLSISATQYSLVDLAQVQVKFIAVKDKINNAVKDFEVG